MVPVPVKKNSFSIASTTGSTVWYQSGKIIPAGTVWYRYRYGLNLEKIVLVLLQLWVVPYGTSWEKKSLLVQ